MPNHKFNSSSRRRTPWDGRETLTPIQAFIKSNYLDSYNYRHRRHIDTNESELLNTFKLSCCKHCGSDNIKRNGYTSNHIQRYKCLDCGKSFTVLTNTLFENHKISIIEWIEYLLNLFGYVSFSSTSRNSKIASTTTKYWLIKLFEVLNDYQDSIVLKDNVYIDETYYRVIKSKLKFTDQNSLSIVENKYCIGIGFDYKYVFCKVEGRSNNTSYKWTFQTFGNHIEKGATLIHDSCYSHKILVEKLGLINKAYNASDCLKMDDKDNPLQPINDKCSMLKMFLNAHRGFNRDYLQDYLNLFCFISNPPHNKLEKIEYLLNKITGINKTIKYRDTFSKNTDK